MMQSTDVEDKSLCDYFSKVFNLEQWYKKLDFKLYSSDKIVQNYLENKKNNCLLESNSAFFYKVEGWKGRKERRMKRDGWAKFSLSIMEWLNKSMHTISGMMPGRFHFIKGNY